MNKLSLKWKLFLIACYVQFVIFFSMFVVSTIGMLSATFISTKDLLIFFLPAIAIVLICLNNVLNILAVHRNFPDIPISKKMTTFMRTVGIINIFISGGILLTCLAGFFEINRHQQNNDGYMIGTLLLFVFLWLIGLYTLILQFQLFGFLNKNQKSNISSLIDSIGKDE